MTAKKQLHYISQMQL